MTLLDIGVFGGAAAFYRWLLPAHLRGWFLLVASVLAIYYMQPNLPIRYVEYILPTATLALGGWVWLGIRQDSNRRDDLITAGVIVALMLAIASTRYLLSDLRPNPLSRPPAPLYVAIALLIVGGIYAIYYRWRSTGLLILLIIGLFVVLKAEPLALESSRLARRLTDQSLRLAAVTDWGWLGFSYVAFRLLHVLFDKQNNLLPPLTLREFMTYLIFFPAFTAGPIDRAERFVEDYRQLPQLDRWAASPVVIGVTRIGVGCFKKFVIADTLAIAALNSLNAEQTTSTLGLWLLLYGYAFRLFFDFSGYSDIAIGIGYLFGIALPENFDRPYLRTNIATFWQSWHMTLSAWARSYVFSPISRRLLRRKPRPSSTVIVGFSQTATMLVIGLWHGVTINFVIWGLWHAAGLFIYKLWNDRAKMYFLELPERRNQLLNIPSVLLTFHFVALGWVWFALPDFETAASVFVRLFGL